MISMRVVRRATIDVIDRLPEEDQMESVSLLTVPAGAVRPRPSLAFTKAAHRAKKECATPPIHPPSRRLSP